MQNFKAPHSGAEFIMAGDRDKKGTDPKVAQYAIQKSSNVNLEKAAMGAMDIDAKITVYVALACLVAASGGVLFGYDGALQVLIALSAIEKAV